MLIFKMNYIIVIILLDYVRNTWVNISERYEIYISHKPNRLTEKSVLITLLRYANTYNRES